MCRTFSCDPAETRGGHTSSQQDITELFLFLIIATEACLWAFYKLLKTVIFTSLKKKKKRKKDYINE